MMHRSLHHLLGFGVSPLHHCRPRTLASLPFTKPRGGGPLLLLLLSHQSPPFAVLSCRWGGGRFRAFRMSSRDSDAVPPPVAHKSEISFCQNCGSPTKQLIPDGEEKLRAVCTHCGRIHYENPKMISLPAN